MLRTEGTVVNKMRICPMDLQTVVRKIHSKPIN